MTLSEDLDQFLNDFGSSCTAGAVSALGILDMPGRVIGADGMVISTDYVLTAKASDFGGLLYGDAISVAGIAYSVREVLPIDDGSFVEIAMQRLSPGSPAPGAQPREWGLADLSDVSITNAQQGDMLINDGTNWIDTNTIDGGGAG